MAIGMSSACLYPLEVEKAVEKLCENNIPVIEIFFNSTSELKQDFINNLKAMLQGGSTTVKSCHPLTSFAESYFLFSEYKRRFLDMSDMYKKYYETAASLGAEIVVLHGDKSTMKISDEEYFERYAKMYDDAKKFGVVLAQENVVFFRSQSPQFIEKMNTYLKGNCAFVLDTKQAKRAKVDLYEMADAMGHNLIHLHFSDSDDKNTCLLPGKGNCDLSKIFNYNQAIQNCDKILEVYSNAFSNEQQLFDSYLPLLNKKCL